MNLETLTGKELYSLYNSVGLELLTRYWYVYIGIVLVVALVPILINKFRK